MVDQILGPLDREMARLVEGYLERNCVNVVLKDGAAEFRQSPTGALEVYTQSGAMHPADIVVLGIGVRPDTALAKQAGLEIGALGGIRTDEQMRTSEPDIFAVGDAVEVKDFVTGRVGLGSSGRPGEPARDGSLRTLSWAATRVTAALRAQRSAVCSKVRQPGPAPAKKP